MNLASILLILQMALSLLNTPNLQSNPQLQEQVSLFVNKAIVIANNAITQSILDSQQPQASATQTPASSLGTAQSYNPQTTQSLPSQQTINNTSIPLDKESPRIKTHYNSYEDRLVSWPDPDFPGYGSVNKSCTQCLVIETDEPSTIFISYFDYNSLASSLSSSLDTPEINTKTKIIDDQLKTEPQRLLSFTDSDFKKWHIISYDSLNLVTGIDYVYKFTAKDGAGNVFEQQFTGSYGAPIPWSINQKMKK